MSRIGTKDQFPFIEGSRAVPPGEILYFAGGKLWRWTGIGLPEPVPAPERIAEPELKIGDWPWPERKSE